MRSKLIFIVVVLCLALPVAAQKANFRPEAEKACSVATHHHKYSDLRVAAIEIEDVDACGFSYMDTENNTVGPDQYLKFASDFIVTKVEQQDQSEHIYKTVNLPRKAVKDHAHAIVVYCSSCKEAISLKLD